MKLRKKKKINSQISKGEKRRIPTKIIVCVLMLVILSAPSVFINNIYGYLPVFVFLFAILCSYLYLLIIRRRIIFEEMSDLKNCIRESDVDFTVKLKNKTILVCPKVEPFFYISDLFGNDDTVTAQTITLAPNEDRRFDFSARFDHIGTYSAGVKKIVVHDPLGLFSYTMKNPKDFRVNVSPKVFDVSKIDISSTALTEHERTIVPITTDGSDYVGVRDYVWGDPIKTIHWKLSARTETYLTKQFESYGIVGVTVVLDFFSPEYDSDTLMSVFDAVVETGLSVGVYAEENGMEFEIVYADKKGVKKKFNRAHGVDFAEIIGDMPRISFTEGDEIGSKILSEEGTARYSHGNIVYCTANLTEETAEILTDMKRRRKNPVLLLVAPEKAGDDIKNRFAKPIKSLEYEEISYAILTSAKELGGGEKQNCI